jgi:hypothetical protein
VIDAQEIEACELRADALEPPAEAAPLHRVPVVERIAPVLTVGVEVVGRHAGNRERLAVRVEREQPALPPHIDAVAIDVERQVAEQTDTATVRVALQRTPLQLEQVLLEGERAELLAARGAALAQRRGLAVAVRRGPLPPRLRIEALAQELEEAVRLEPAAAYAHERRERALLLRARERRERRVARGAVSGRSDARRQLRGRAEILRSDEPRIAGVRRAQRVWRAVCIRDAERQRLPNAESALGQPIDEAPRVGAERAARVRTRQRSRMEQDAGTAFGQQLHTRAAQEFRRKPANIRRVTRTMPCSVT